MVDKHKESSRSKMDYLKILPLLVALFLVPIVVHIVKVELSLIEQVALYDGLYFYDFFAKPKAFIAIICGALAMILFVLNLRSYTDPKLQKFYLLILAYIGFVVASTVSAKYLNYTHQNFSSIIYNLDIVVEQTKNVAWFGYANRAEGAYTIMAYLGLAMLSMKLVKEEWQYKWLITASILSALVLGLTGLSQFMGMDIFRSEVGKFLMSLFGTDVDLDLVSFEFGERRVYATLYNPNYVGSYVALLLPVVVASLVGVKVRWQKVVLVITTFLLVINLYGSGSLTGMIGVTSAVVPIIYIIRKTLWKYKKQVLVAFIALVIGSTLFIAFAEVPIATKVRGNFTTVATEGEYLNQAGNSIESIKQIDQGIMIETEEKSLYILKVGEAEYLFADDTATAIPLKYVEEVSLLGKLVKKGGFYEIDHKAFRGDRVFLFNGGDVMNVILQGKTISIQFIEENAFVLGHSMNAYNPTYEVPSIGFENAQSLASYRGYIWSRTLPIMKDNIFIGTGPDTYAIVFPAYDVIGMVNNFQETAFAVDKPHNMYMQIWVQTGLLSLIIFLVINLLYMMGFLKTYHLFEKKSYLRYISMGLFCGIFAYLVTGIANDSVVPVATVYWIFLGLGIGLQVKASKELK